LIKKKIILKFLNFNLWEVELVVILLYLILYLRCTSPASASAFEEAETLYDLLSEEELEKYFRLQEEQRNEKTE
ncbi:MAG: hypothetical protein IKM82_05860, partial [Oscillospiraceae bacterium]|nr:hypothetical protein [Oscillospiraceae bacterium]